MTPQQAFLTDEDPEHVTVFLTILLLWLNAGHEGFIQYSRQKT